MTADASAAATCRQLDGSFDKKTAVVKACRDYIEDTLYISMSLGRPSARPRPPAALPSPLKPRKPSCHRIARLRAPTRPPEARARQERTPSRPAALRLASAVTAAARRRPGPPRGGWPYPTRPAARGRGQRPTVCPCVPIQASVAGEDCDAADGLPLRSRAAGRCDSPEARARGEPETCPVCAWRGGSAAVGPLPSAGPRPRHLCAGLGSPWLAGPYFALGCHASTACPPLCGAASRVGDRPLLRRARVRDFGPPSALGRDRPLSRWARVSARPDPYRPGGQAPDTCRRLRPATPAARGADGPAQGPALAQGQTARGYRATTGGEGDMSGLVPTVSVHRPSRPARPSLLPTVSDPRQSQPRPTPPPPKHTPCHRRRRRRGNTHTHTHTHARTHARTHAHVHTHIKPTPTLTHARTYARTRAHTHNTNTCTHARAHPRARGHTQTHTHTNTHKHKQTRLSKKRARAQPPLFPCPLSLPPFSHNIHQRSAQWRYRRPPPPPPPRGG